jgi:hypothetical protein
MILKSFKFLSVVLLLVGLQSCIKETEVPISDTLKPTTQNNFAEERTGDGCAYSIKINSVSPSNAAWVLAVRNTSGKTYFYACANPDNDPCQIGLSAANDVLNQWYNLPIPPGGGTIKVDLGLMYNSNPLVCNYQPTGSSINYTIKGPAQPYPNTNSFTKTLVWQGPTTLVFDKYSLSNNCVITELVDE